MAPVDHLVPVVLLDSQVCTVLLEFPGLRVVLAWWESALKERKGRRDCLEYRDLKVSYLEVTSVKCVLLFKMSLSSSMSKMMVH